MKSQFLILLRAKVLMLRRLLGRNAFLVFVIGPLIVGGFAFILEPLFQRASGWLQASAPDWTGADLLAVSLFGVTALIAAGSGSAVRQAYGLGSPDSYLDALPLRSGPRFHLAVLSQFLRNLPAWLAAWGLVEILARTADVETRSYQPGAALLVFVEVALLQMLAVMLLVRLGALRTVGAFGVGLAAGAGALVVRQVPAAAILFGPLLIPASFWQRAIGDAVGGGPTPPGWMPTAAAQAASAAVLYWFTAWFYSRWRDEDRERALALLSRRRSSVVLAPAWLIKRLGAPLAAQLGRDLLLLRRVFSPVVFVAAAGALLFWAAGLTAALTEIVGPIWTSPLVVACSGMAAISISALAPLLLQHQLDRLWLECATGAQPDGIYRSKLLMARILSLVVWVAFLPLVWLTPASGWTLALFPVQMLLSCLSGASVIGAMAIGIAPSPVLGMLLGGLFAMGVCGFYAIPDYWPMGVFLYAYVMHYLGAWAEAAATRLGAEA